MWQLAQLLPRIIVGGVLLFALAPPLAAAELDLSGTYLGKWVDKGRNITRNNFRIKITHSGDQISGITTDDTIKVKGMLVENKIFLEWDHSSGNYGDGVWDVLEDGSRLKGTWDSKGSGRFYGEWDLLKQ